MTIEGDYPSFSDYREDPVQPAAQPGVGSAFTGAYASSTPTGNGQEPAEQAPRPEPAVSGVDVGAAQVATPPAERSGNDGAFPEQALIGNGEARSLDLPDNLTAKLPGFTKPASDCINKARRIARELNHTSVSAAHLTLALTLDPRSSRRLRDQGIDVDLVREAAVRYLAKYNCMYSSGALPAMAEPKASPDLTDIMEAATRFAQEREDEEEINISDLLDAFRKSGSGSKMIYAVAEAPDQVPAVIRRVEQGVAQQLDQLFAEIERRLQAAPQLDQLLADMERRLLAQAEERLATLFSDANAQLAQQIYTLRQIGAQLGEQVNAMARTNSKPTAGSWWSSSR